MIKVNLPNTWGYENFISDDEQSVLIDFANYIRPKLRNNGFGRFYHDHIKVRYTVPKEFDEVKARIIETEQLENFILDPIFGDFISFNENGGAIHKHKDNNEPGFIHTRYNLICSMPDVGGNPIYENDIVEVKEKMLWRCEAGLYNHSSVEVRGSKPRINISFGFQIKK